MERRFRTGQQWIRHTEIRCGIRPVTRPGSSNARIITDRLFNKYWGSPYVVDQKIRFAMRSYALCRDGLAVADNKKIRDWASSQYPRGIGDGSKQSGWLSRTDQLPWTPYIARFFFFSFLILIYSMAFARLCGPVKSFFSRTSAPERSVDGFQISSICMAK